MADAPDAFDARATYDAASRDYEDASREYWQYLSPRIAAAKVERSGLTQVELKTGDVTALNLEGGSFDAVLRPRHLLLR